MQQNKRINVVFSYSWNEYPDSSGTGLDTAAFKAFKTLKDYILSFASDDPEKVDFRRLRGTAGGFIFETIYERLRKSDVFIADITNHNANVMIELGIAWAIQREKNNSLKIYLICNSNNCDTEKLPSNLLGYYLSDYKISEDSSIVFLDQNSLRLSLQSNIKELLRRVDDTSQTGIDEIIL